MMNIRLAAKVAQIIRLHSRDMKVKAIKSLRLSVEMTWYLIDTYCAMPKKSDGEQWIVTRYWFA